MRNNIGREAEVAHQQVMGNLLFRQIVCCENVRHLKKLLLTYSKIDLHQTWGEGEPKQGNALIWATHLGNYTIVEELVKWIDANLREKQMGWPPLHFASKNNDCCCTSILIEAGANIDNVDRHNETALHIACWKGNYDVARLLVRHGANIHVKNLDGQTALDLAVQYSHKHCQELFRRHKID